MIKTIDRLQALAQDCRDQAAGAIRTGDLVVAERYLNLAMGLSEGAAALTDAAVPALETGLAVRLLEQEVERLKKHIHDCQVEGTKNVLEMRQAKARAKHFEEACVKQNHAIEQTLGKALGYMWYKDDQENFPGATEEQGVFIGLDCAETLADAAAARITVLMADVDTLKRALAAQSGHAQVPDPSA